MISTFNSRWALSERRLAKYQQELSTTRHTLAQANRDLDEAAKLAEILYETNRRMGLITDFLLKSQGLKDGEGEPKSFDAMFSWVTKQAGLTLEPDAQGGVTVQEGVDDEAAAGASVLMNMGNDCNNS